VNGASPRYRIAVAFGLAGSAMAVGAVAGWIGWREARDQWFYSYLTAWLFWAGIALGSLAILLLYNLTGGAWGRAARPALSAAAATVPLVGLLFLPIALNVGKIYPWASASAIANDPVLQHKKHYLNIQFFQIRAGIYFALWLALAALTAWQRGRVVAPGSLAERRVRRFSGMGLGLHGLAVTFASIDWMMSLEPHWFSTIYGVIVFGAQGLAALAWAILVTTLASRADLTAGNPNALHDLGKLLLAFLMFWAYVSFCQFLIIWYGNLPEEVVWYLRRFAGGWAAVALALVVFHFAVPFLALLSRNLKRRRATLGAVAAFVLIMHWIDALWQIQPAVPHAQGYQPWLDAALWLGLGGLWAATFLVSYRGRLADGLAFAEGNHE
jgi:hypothetical protein